MLFTDTPFVSFDDLQHLDSNVASVVEANSILVDAHIESAIQEVGEKILSAMQSFSATFYYADTQDGSIYNNTPLQPIHPGQIVIDNTWTMFWSPIKRATANKALMLVYRDASNRLKEDIYDKKSTTWKRAFEREWNVIRIQGIPLVYVPVPAPAATYEPNSGTWDSSTVPGSTDGSLVNVPLVAVPGTLGGVFDVAVSYSRADVEGYRSALVTVTVPAGSAISADISTLIPPAATPVTSWNLYVGRSGLGPLFRQAQIPITTLRHSLAADPVLTGIPAGRGQMKDVTAIMPAIALLRA